MTHLKALGMAAVLAGTLSFGTAASAAPLAVAPLSSEAIIETVAGGCGPGFHPNPWGICRPNWGYGPRRFYGPGYGYYRPRPYYGPYGFYGPRRFYN